MTNEQSAIFSKILDLNYELATEELDYDDSKELRRESYRLQAKLIESMGFDAYTNFIQMGKEMFKTTI
jgi:hypothetical protein